MTRGRNVFDLIIAAGLSFVLLTTLAMLFYPGGTATNHASGGYAFFTNYFSDLGRTNAQNGAPNPVSATLFAVALTMAGGTLILFFVAFARFFWTGFFARVMCGFGASLGIIAGLCFIGVAFTPANLYGGLHIEFVLWAFRTFLFAVIFYDVAIVTGRNYPRAGAWIFIAFAILLGGYLVLITKGPKPNTFEGLFIQATGQKIIVYASVLSVLLQSLIARRLVAKSKKIS